MTTLNIHSRTDAEGKLRIEEMSLGVANADVDVLLTIRPNISREEFRARLEKVAASIDPALMGRYPPSSLRDPWEAP